MSALFTSESYWRRIALIAAIAIVVGATLMVTSHRARTAVTELEPPTVETCIAITAEC